MEVFGVFNALFQYKNSCLFFFKKRNEPDSDEESSSNYSSDSEKPWDEMNVTKPSCKYSGWFRDVIWYKNFYPLIFIWMINKWFLKKGIKVLN